jgi:flagellar protein FliS|uniref:Flagellar secretion chaperone FliS n=1 Tax=Desulfobacca acetoxidans TaxID=60893 RepID=A0A7C5ANJ4_9BACT
MKNQLAHQQYLTTQVATADRLQLVVMLYDGAIAFLGQAKEKMKAKDAAGKGLFIGRALDIIAELNASLNFQAGGEVARNLFHLYNFMTAHLTKANINWDLKALEEVLTLLKQLRESWVEVARRAKRGELMEDTAASELAPQAHLESVRV